MACLSWIKSFDSSEGREGTAHAAFNAIAEARRLKVNQVNSKSFAALCGGQTGEPFFDDTILPGAVHAFIRTEEKVVKLASLYTKYKISEETALEAANTNKVNLKFSLDRRYKEKTGTCAIKGGSCGAPLIRCALGSHLRGIPTGSAPHQ